MRIREVELENTKEKLKNNKLRNDKDVEDKYVKYLEQENFKMQEKKKVLVHDLEGVNRELMMIKIKNEY